LATCHPKFAVAMAVFHALVDLDPNVECHPQDRQHREQDA
jgi:hypothetical protein